MLIDYFPENSLHSLMNPMLQCPVGGMYEVTGQGNQLGKPWVQASFRLDNRPFTMASLSQCLTRLCLFPHTFQRGIRKSSDCRAGYKTYRAPDPEVIIRPTKGQIEDIYSEIRKRISMGKEPVTTLQKMAEVLQITSQGWGSRSVSHQG